MAAIPPDYDADPDRRRSWEAPQDVHDLVGPELHGPVLDVGCGEGRLAGALNDGVRWIGVDSSPAQLAVNPHRPVVLADMRALPFRSGIFAEVTHLWCLYHLEEPVSAIAEAKRVLRPGGRHYSSTSARDSDPELAWGGYPASTFDAEEGPAIVSSVFDRVSAEYWDGKFFPLAAHAEVVAYCRHNSIPQERAAQVEVPLWLTKRGVLVRAEKQ
jgi:SAM-dependent methyltransferase